MKLLRKATTIFDSTNRILGLMSGIILVYIMLSVCMEMAVRYVGHPTTWVIEVATYGLLFMAFLSTAWLLREGDM